MNNPDSLLKKIEMTEKLMEHYYNISFHTAWRKQITDLITETVLTQLKKYCLKIDFCHTYTGIYSFKELKGHLIFDKVNFVGNYNEGVINPDYVITFKNKQPEEVGTHIDIFKKEIFSEYCVITFTKHTEKKKGSINFECHTNFNHFRKMILIHMSKPELLKLIYSII